MTKYISIDDFIAYQEPSIQVLIFHLRKLIGHAHPKMKERFIFNTPMFMVKRDICYIGKIHPKKGLEICFLRGYQLSNEQGLLDAKGRMFIHGIILKNAEDLKEKETAFCEILQEAIILDEINDKSIFSEILHAGRKKKS